MEKFIKKIKLPFPLISQASGSLITFLWWSTVLLWLILSIGWRPLKSPDEARYVSVAWEMLNIGQWWLPTINGMPFFHKPPLYYWLTELSLYGCGINAFCLRLVPVSAAFATCLVLFFFIRRYFSTTLAYVTILVLVTLPFFYFAAQFSNPDMLVSTFTTLTILATAHAIYLRESDRPHQKMLILAYISAALGILSKGLIAIILPGLVIVSWMLLTNRAKQIVTLFSWRGFAGLLLIAVPWVLWVEFHYPGFTKYFFIHHHFERYTQVNFNNKQPFWFFFVLLPLLSLPWSLCLLKSGRSIMSSMSDKQKDIMTLMITWVSIILLFFSWPLSKPPGYILPVLPAFAALIAMIIVQKLPGERLFKVLNILLLLAAVLCLCAIKITQIHDTQKSGALLSNYLKQQVNPEDKVILLDKYQYDLRSSLGLHNPVGVVDAWDANNVDRYDNWRRELHEAGQFAQFPTSDILILPQHLDRAICTQAVGQIWIIGHQWQERSVILSQIKPIYILGDLPIWQITQKTNSRACQHIMENHLLKAPD